MKDELATNLRRLRSQLSAASELLDKADTTPLGQIEKLLDGIADRVATAQRVLNVVASELEARELA